MEVVEADGRLEPLFQALEGGEPFPFGAWPNEGARVGVGVYTVWDGDRLLYVGVAGRPGKVGGPGGGLFTRLASHAGGRRSGDQFCVYVCDRLVLPTLTPEEIKRVADGELSLDAKVKQYVRSRLAYRFVSVGDYATALRVEAAIKGGALRAGKPLLNPAGGGYENKGVVSRRVK